MENLIKDCVALYRELNVLVMGNTTTNLEKRNGGVFDEGKSSTFSKMSRSELTVRSPLRTTSKTFMLGALKYTSLIFRTRR